ncbi:presenilin enhancer, gamma-secretase subunit isoform X3 [Tachypleus tridentatus]|uniref:presenilin enhancer, gamma-secretase subunit isoform X3 n=1 Tax=Tachypleus tridentatus TaxID=6853 RepID=UPI003FCFEF73
MKDEDKLNLCRWYYKGGFCFLPFLWFLNSVWFFSEAFRRPHFEQQKEIKSFMVVLVTEQLHPLPATGLINILPTNAFTTMLLGQLLGHFCG